VALTALVQEEEDSAVAEVLAVAGLFQEEDVKVYKYTNEGWRDLHPSLVKKNRLLYERKTRLDAF
jgi:hypothetical protein